MQIKVIQLTAILLVCLAAAIYAVFAAPASDTMDFLKGVKDYQAGEYRESSEQFLKVTESGVANGKLFYNLGNAYLKQDDLGRTILWYERAHLLMPRDPDINFNLHYAGALVKDKAEEKISPLIKSIFFWNYLLSFTEVIWISIASVALFWITLFLRKIYANRFDGAGLRIASYTLLAFSLVFVLTCFYNFYERAYAKQGIILPESVSIRSGLSDHSTQLFVLHAGSKVDIQSHKNDYVKILFSSGKLGWIKRSDIGIITP